MERVYLLLGTNLGKLKENLMNAIEELSKNGIKILRKSKIYKTKPWGKTDQPDFLNMAVEVETNLTPEKLLQTIKDIEKKLKREKSKKWGPRIIDIDILFYGNRIVNEPDLKIPHPYFFERNFAIIPMAEIAPDFIPPAHDRSIKEVKAGVKSEGIEIYCD
ncbi:MAG: 2-amino-4-hydroxy-6-hydroxymethyldihydropteridine diphosphokinase [candidate division WOR-3 bacterium]